MLPPQQLKTRGMIIKKPSHKNEILRPEEAALTGRNPEMLVGPFMVAVVVDVDLSLRSKCQMSEYVVVR